jgi:two-component system nitrate/nitrite response regulator NarL
MPKRQTKKKAGICEDHEPFADGLCLLLETPRLKDRVELVLRTDNGASLMNSPKLKQLDLLLLDIELPSINGRTITKTLTQDFPSIDILVITQFERVDYFRELFSCGVKGYVTKSESRNTLIGAIEDVISGNHAFSPSFSPNTVNSFASGPRHRQMEKLFDSLTRREIEIFTLVAEGKTTSEIAKILGISIHTVNHHRSNICKKLKTQNIDDMVELARLKGLGGRFR